MILTGTGIIDSANYGPSPPAVESFFVAGDFTTYKGQTRNRFVKLDTTGSEVAGFSIGSGPTGGLINVVREALDGKIYVGGSFTSLNGQQANRIIRLNSDGTWDSTFDNSTGFNGTVRDIRITNQGIYVGGEFTSYKGVAANRIIRLNPNGSRDTSFDIGTGFSSSSGACYIAQILIYGTQIYTLGRFSTYKGANLYGIIRINSDGSRDANFANANFLITCGQISSFECATIQSDGKIIVSGYAARCWSNPPPYINYQRRLNTNGTTDFSWPWTEQGIGSVDSQMPKTILQDSSGNVYYSGNFPAAFLTFSNPQLYTNGFLVKLLSSGTYVNAFNSVVRQNTTPISSGNFGGIAKPGPIPPYSSINSSFISENKIYFGGNFTTVVANPAPSSRSRNRIASVNTDGTNNSDFDPGTGFNGEVFFVGK